MRYSIEPRDKIYVKGYDQKLLDSDKKSTTD